MIKFVRIFGFVAFILVMNCSYAECNLIYEGKIFHCPTHLDDPQNTQFIGAIITYFKTVVCIYSGDGGSYDCHNYTPNGYVSTGPNWTQRADNMFECSFAQPVDPISCLFSQRESNR